jgi:UDPglucose 6-dehydrogenase
MNISIIGTGYVGLVTGTCLADFGLQVTCVDQDETKISLLNKESKVIFIAVGTPSHDDGSANLVQIEEVAKQIALSINNYQVPPSLRVTEGSAAIPSSVIQTVSNYIFYLT